MFSEFMLIRIALSAGVKKDIIKMVKASFIEQTGILPAILVVLPGQFKVETSWKRKRVIDLRKDSERVAVREWLWTLASRIYNYLYVRF